MQSVPILHEGRSLQLRRTVPNDAALLFHQGFSQRAFMRLFRLNDTPQSEAAVYQNLVRRQQNQAHNNAYLEMLIIHRRHGPIGLCALADYSCLHRRAEYLVGLFDANRRQASYGLETTLMVLDLAFNTYQMNKVFAATYAYNTVAQKGLRSVGFQLAGRRKEHVFDRASHSFVDLLFYDLTVSEFRNTQRLVPLSQRLLNRDITQAIAMPLHTTDDAPKSGCLVMQSA